MCLSRCLGREFRPAVRSDTSSSVRERERASPVRKCLIQLTVHEGRGLPLVQDERNRYVSPNSFISVLVRDGELRSTVLKVFHHDISGDKTLGFVSIPLPIEEAHRVDYEMVDLTGTANINGEVPIITMSMEASAVISRPNSNIRMRSSSGSLTEPMSCSRTTSPHSASTCSNCRRLLNNSPIITATREELSEKLKKNLADLDQLIRVIKK
ncbi:hypothetical protein KIN20_033437 [Parelaphostrongylus tenuis]|uniref:Uncharacterized protein n=1 Tax=Parelaphostrongylus tenuis TaxID=148309 RepID=A0AAD5R8J3_PARTN|nr:hypothetical protein KIN20_033437 [Parelaphostrongylus tenuis]